MVHSLLAPSLTYLPEHDFAISIIDAPDYRALSDCTFHTAGEQTLVGGLSDEGMQQVIIGPPQPITGVSCFGTCVGTYGMSMCGRFWQGQTNHEQASATMITTSGLAPAAMGTVLPPSAGLGSTLPSKENVLRGRSGARFRAYGSEVINYFKVLWNRPLSFPSIVEQSE